MVEVVGVRFKKVGRVYYFDPQDIKLKEGDYVIVETARGIEHGEVVIENREVSEAEIVPPLKKVLRASTPEDEKRLLDNAKKGKDAFSICEKKIAEHKLDMKLIDVEYTFDNNKILFYFSADGRVDFRNLVKDLASIFKTRIELRQIGVRDEAKMLGGIGICGQTLCCSTFLNDFEPVSIKMAKEQGLSLNPTKISGNCGRLMCCLKYEQDSYEHLLKTTPLVGSYVSTPSGEGVVTEVSLLTGNLKIHLNASPELAVTTFKKGDVKVLKRPKPQVKDDDISELSLDIE